MALTALAPHLTLYGRPLTAVRRTSSSSRLSGRGGWTVVDVTKAAERMTGLRGPNTMSCMEVVIEIGRSGWFLL